MKSPRVIEVIRNYEEGGIPQVYKYLTQPDMCVDPSTWSANILNLIKNKNIVTASSIIELVSYKFIKNKQNE